MLDELPRNHAFSREKEKNWFYGEFRGLFYGKHDHGSAHGLLHTVAHGTTRAVRRAHDLRTETRTRANIVTHGSVLMQYKTSRTGEAKQRKQFKAANTSRTKQQLPNFSKQWRNDRLQLKR